MHGFANQTLTQRQGDEPDEDNEANSVTKLAQVCAVATSS